MLSLSGVNTYYGYSHVLHDVSLEVREGEIVVLLGRNGVGKSTTMKSIMGVQPPKSGRVLFQGEDITGLPPYKIAAKGISLIPEDRRVIPNLTVYENLKLGSLVRRKSGNGSFPQLLDTALTYFPRLKERLGQKGGSLSGGEQQMLTIARGLMASPRLMLIDEPSEGLAPKVIQEIMRIIQKLQQDGVTILLVEQHVEAAMRLSDNLRAYIMEKGEIRLFGTLDELNARMDEVIRCLGAKI
ncbi:MAG: ABC transporter ATP-binding protein [Candidatus Korobacteraceae bacterium]|jgi:branched-chain amino acid transport system ATP-binding protein